LDTGFDTKVLADQSKTAAAASSSRALSTRRIAAIINEDETVRGFASDLWISRAFLNALHRTGTI
jgi:hypothetical protein